jgi:3-oxoacyl-[acyl-carrier-protein] synthase-3
MRKTSILGTGSYLPERVIRNDYFEKIVETSDQWITERTGIKERRMIRPGQPLSHLAVPAAMRALDMAGVHPDELDLIVVGTVSADMITPSAACIIQHKIGAHKATAFDVNAACPGFIYALTVAQKFIKDGSHDLALVIGGEVISNHLDFSDRATCVLFGDGAGAVVLGPGNGEESEVLSSSLGSNGSLWGLLNVPGGGSLHPPSVEMVNLGLHYIKMKGNEVFKYAVKAMVEGAQRVMEDAGVDSEGVDWLIPHQANLRIMQVVGNRLGFPTEKIIITVNKYGNTSAASIPIALDEAVREGRIKRGDTVLMVSFGAGFTWGGLLVRF